MAMGSGRITLELDPELESKWVVTASLPQR